MATTVCRHRENADMEESHDQPLAARSNRAQRGGYEGEGSLKALPLAFAPLRAPLLCQDRVKRKPALRGRNRAEG